MPKKKVSPYIEAREKAIRTKTAQLTRDQENAILKAYTDAGKTLVSKLKNPAYATNKAMYQDYAYQLHEQIVRLQLKYSKASVLNPMQEEVLVTLDLLGKRGAFESEYGIKLKKISNIYSEKAVENLIKGDLYKDGLGLSERIWRNSSRAGTVMQEIVAEGLASGMSAADMSQLLEPHVRGSTKRKWANEKIAEKLGKGYAKKYENLEYNALRLARTTISHGATSGMREAASVNPLFKYIEWHSVHAPGRTCQICIDMDGNLYKVEECPFDHPNGLCYQTHYFEESMEEMALRLRSWVDDPLSDPEIENWWIGVNKEIAN